MTERKWSGAGFVRGEAPRTDLQMKWSGPSEPHDDPDEEFTIEDLVVDDESSVRYMKFLKEVDRMVLEGLAYGGVWRVQSVRGDRENTGRDGERK